MGYKLIKLIHNFLQTIISVNTIMMIRLSGGFYYKISSNRTVCVIAAVYCLVICLCLSTCIIEKIDDVSPAMVVKAVSSLTIYNSCVINSLLTNSEYFQDYLSNIEGIDILLGVRPDIDVPVTRFLLLAVVTIQLSVALPFYWSMVENGAPATAQINFIRLSYFVLSCGMSNLTRIMMFELMWSRVKMFRQYLEIILSRASRSQCSEDARNTMRQCMLIYQKILDTIKKSDIPVKSMIIVSVISSVPKIVASVYELVSGSRQAYQTLRVHELTVEVVLTCLPAVLTALTRGEVQRMKFVISRQILTCEDHIREVLDDCLSYLEYRPCRYSVCRLFAVDMDLVFNLVSLYVSYSLAMIQFGHFFN